MRGQPRSTITCYASPENVRMEVICQWTYGSLHGSWRRSFVTLFEINPGWVPSPDDRAAPNCISVVMKYFSGFGAQ